MAELGPKFKPSSQRFRMLVPATIVGALALEELERQVLSCQSGVPRPFPQYTLLPRRSAGKFLKYQRTQGVQAKCVGAELGFIMRQ